MANGTLTEAHARALDARDPLGRFRDRFYVPADTIYLDGNSLGLLSLDAEAAIVHALASWKRHGVNGWLDADPPWFTMGERIGEAMAPLIGASPHSVVATGTTTVNLHQLVGTFYRPTGARRRIVATSLDFPSDVYALQSQIRLQGGDPDQDLVLVESRDGRTIDEEDIIDALTDDVALVLLPSVLYRSGQLLDMPALTRAAHERGAVIGFDCAHSIGSVPHELDAWDVDFAFWCTYKYLNGGPGSIGGLYLHPRHSGQDPALAGWWGYRKDRQFAMVHEWEGAEGAGAFQVSTVPVLSTAGLLGSLTITREAGIGAIRDKSLAQTEYLMSLVEEAGLCDEPYAFRIGTPKEPSSRGGHVALEHDAAAQISTRLRERHVIVDFRAPNVIRIAPVALYTTWHELWQTVAILREIIGRGEHLTTLSSALVT